MPVEVIKEKWVGAVREVKIGATPEEGGTRKSVVRVGGATGLPFLHFEGVTPNAPKVAMEVTDVEPGEWPAPLREALGDCVRSPGEWAARCERDFGAELILLRLASIDPDGRNAGPEQAQASVREVLASVGLPLIIIGCGNADKDNEVMPAVAEASAGENCLLGIAKQDNYRSLVASCMVHKHSVIAQSPLDINICKQLNILITEMGFPAERIVIDSMSGALGYGIEYCYSIMERVRLGALQGDKMLAMPIVAFVGQEAWRSKEAREPEAATPGWGPEATRGPLWEMMTGSTLLQAGADLLVTRHPLACQKLREHIRELMAP